MSETPIFEMRVRFADDTREWQEIPASDYPAANMNALKVAAMVFIDRSRLAGQPAAFRVREVRINAKGSLQGHYIA